MIGKCVSTIQEYDIFKILRQLIESRDWLQPE
jgi:hypothetical protein